MECLRHDSKEAKLQLKCKDQVQQRWLSMKTFPIKYICRQAAVSYDKRQSGNLALLLLHIRPKQKEAKHRHTGPPQGFILSGSDREPLTSCQIQINLLQRRTCRTVRESTICCTGHQGNFCCYSHCCCCCCY